jgi:hypothetical protein
MNSLWDIRIFLGLVPKESPCTISSCDTHENLFCLEITTWWDESMRYENRDPEIWDSDGAQCQDMSASM